VVEVADGDECRGAGAGGVALGVVVGRGGLEGQVAVAQEHVHAGGVADRQRRLAVVVEVSQHDEVGVMPGNRLPPPG